MGNDYTDEFRAKAVLRAEELGNVRAAARELDVHPSTLSRWMKGERKPHVQQMAAQVKQSMLERLEEGAMVFYDAIMEAHRERKYSPAQLLTAFGIIADKVIMLKRQTETRQDTSKLDELVDAVRKARAKRE